MRLEWILLLLAFAAGTAVPVQFAVNAEMRSVVGGPIVAAAISFLIGTVALIVRCSWRARGCRPRPILQERRGGRGPGDFSGASTLPPRSS